MQRGLALASFLLATTAAAQDNYRYAYLSHAEGEVSLQRASESEPESGALNVPLLPGDRVWTHAGARAEIRIGAGLVVHLSERAKLDLVANEADTILRLWSGSAILRISEPPGELRLDTAAGSVRPTREGSFRVDVESDDAVTLEVERGSAELASSLGTVLVQSGETSFATPSSAPSIPAQFNTASLDEFDRWSDGRDARRSRTEEIVVRSLPHQVRSYTYDLADYGDWYQEPDYGYVWYPQVDVGWSPYTYGRWGYTRWGHTWISSEPWGWAPYHYGRWGFGHRGWYWIPGATWGPAWVSFAIGPTWVGWSPLGYYNNPVFAFNTYYGGFGYGYGYGHGYGRGYHHRGGWNVCSRDDFRSGYVTRAGYRRLEPESLRTSASGARIVNEISSLDRDLNPRTARAREGASVGPGTRSRSDEALRAFRERAASPSPRRLDDIAREASPRSERPSEVSDIIRRGREIQNGPVARETPARERRGAPEPSRAGGFREAREARGESPRARTVPDGVDIQERQRTSPTGPTRGTRIERSEAPRAQPSRERFERARDRAMPILTPPARSERTEARPTNPRTTRGEPRGPGEVSRPSGMGSRMRAPETNAGSRGGVERPSMNTPRPSRNARPEMPSMRTPSQRQMSGGGGGRSSGERSSSMGARSTPRSNVGGGGGSARGRGSQSTGGNPGGGPRGGARSRSNQN
jgi:FecR protein